MDIHRKQSMEPKIIKKMNCISLNNIELLFHFWIQYFNQMNQKKQRKRSCNQKIVFAQLENLQKYPNLIEYEFKNQWKFIVQAQQSQIENIFQEYSVKQYKAISSSLAQFRLKTTREQHIQDEFNKKINSSSPFLNEIEEKTFFLKIFIEELQEQQFITHDSKNCITIFGDIFSQPIVNKLQKVKQTDLININHQYNFKFEYYYINVQDLNYQLKFSILEDFKLVILLNQFKLDYDENTFDSFLKAINEKPYFFQTWKSYDENVLKLFENLQKTFSLSNKKIVLNNFEFFQSFNSNFKSQKC